MAHALSRSGPGRTHGQRRTQSPVSLSVPSMEMAMRQFNPAERLETTSANDYSRLKERVDGLAERRVSVSIIVMFRNETDLLFSLLASLDEQTYSKNLYEIIVVDDDSTQPPGRAIVPFESTLRIRTVHVPNHRPCRFATLRNTGLSMATGETVICLDQDIICSPEFVDAHARWHHFSDAAAVFGLRRYVDTSHLVDPADRTWSHCSTLPPAAELDTGTPKYDKRREEVSLIKSHPAPYNCFHGCNISFTRHLANDLGGFESDFDGAYGYEDMEFGHRLWKAGAYLVHDPRAEVLHQENAAVPESFKARTASANREKLYQRAPELRVVRAWLAQQEISLSVFQRETGS